MKLLHGRAVCRLLATAIMTIGLGCSACRADAPQGPRTFFVDFEHGSDAATGTSPDQAWRRAPGDPEATDQPARERLQPGDSVLFRGGVAYRGSIRFTFSGEPGRPITYRGDGFGPGKAIFSGRDLLQADVAPCASSPSCAGLTNANDLRVIKLPVVVQPSDQILIGGRMLQLAQAPQQPQPFWYDDLDHYQPAPLQNVVSDGAHVRLRSDFIRAALGGRGVEDLVVYLWGGANRVSSFPGERYDPVASELVLTAAAFKPYPDRDTRFALANHPALLRSLYDYATIAQGHGVIVQAPLVSGPLPIEVSRRRLAFDIRGEKHIVIEGFEITGYAGGVADEGVGALRAYRGSEDIAFTKNDVHDLTSWAGSSAIQANGVDGLRIIDNQFVRLWRGFGVSIGGHTVDASAIGNRFDFVGRTGIGIFGADRVWIDHNRLTNLLGSHSNGISIYLDNRDVLISNNLVSLTPRAFTFEGSDQGTAPNRISIRRNILVGTGTDGTGIQSWGGGGLPSRQVQIVANVIAGDRSTRYALRLNAADEGVVVRFNVIDGLVLNGAPTDWAITDNVFMKDNYFTNPAVAASIEPLNRRDPNLQGPVLRLPARSAQPSADICRVLRGDATIPDPDWTGLRQDPKVDRGIGPDDLCSR